MFEKLRYLLLQIRNADDPMLQQEVDCFARTLKTSRSRITTFDLITACPSQSLIDTCDVVLLGGSGHYSAAGNSHWLEPAFDTLRHLESISKPTFASCWGFQAFARALGGEVINSPERAEVGTHQLFLTEAGKTDPVFSQIDDPFWGQMGHEDCVVRLPKNAVRLASSRRVENQAYRIEGRPIYCTQFHPELSRIDLLARVAIYPEYVHRVVGVSIDEFARQIRETPETEALLPRFVETVFG